MHRWEMNKSPKQQCWLHADSPAALEEHHMGALTRHTLRRPSVKYSSLVRNGSDKNAMTPKKVQNCVCLTSGTSLQFSRIREIQERKQRLELKDS